LVSSAFAQTEAPAIAPAAPAVPETTTAQAEHGGKHTFPPFDPSTYGMQLFWLVIAFGILFILMRRVAVPRIGGILEERDKQIAGDIAEAGRLKTESEAAMATYEKALAEARQNAHQIGQQARDASKAEVDADRARTEAGLNEKLAASEAEIAKVKAEALAGVDAIAKDAVEAMVQTLVGTKVDKAAIARAVETAMAEGA
jgi:F-type H+-transporting ATPase subunit b